MYTSYFGLTDKPFSITPDPRFLFLSERHAEALAHLQYGVLESGGFIQLTGEVGTGKTTVMRTLLGRLPDTVDIAAILNPQVDLLGFLRTICSEFGLDDDSQDHKTLLDALNEHLLRCHASGRRAVLIIDEAQNLDRSVLEQIRLLTNLETETAKLLQIILIGQPELRETLDRADLRQLAQRITGRYHLGALTPGETADYVRHRLDVAGATQDIFTAGALREVHRCAGGIPRLINVICDRALLGAYSRMKRRVDPALVRRASHEIRGRRRDDRRPLPLAMAGGAVALAAVVAAVAGWQLSTRPDAPALARRDAGVAIEAAPARPAVRMAGGPSNAVAAPVATADAAGSDRRADGPAGDGGAGDAMRPAPAAGGAAQTPAPVNAANPPPRRDSAPGASSGAAGPADAGVPSLHALLVQHADVTTTEDAFDRLFARWAVAEPPADTSPCAWARENGLRCEVQLGSWALLAVMNRPAILSLVDDAGQRHHVLATALAGDRVELQIGAAPVTLSLGEVTPHWMGEYLLLWRPNPQADELMLPGMRGPGVRWLRESLSRLSPDDADTVNVANADYYDASLTDQVREFQRQARLSADGKAGLRTLIALNSALNPADTPSLSGGPFGSEALDRAPWVSGPPIADGRSALDARRSRE